MGIKIATTEQAITEDDAYAITLYFTSQSEDAIRDARTLIALHDTPALQRRYLLHSILSHAKNGNQNQSMTY